MLIKADGGSIGIGTTSPAQKVQIDGGNLLVNPGTNSAVAYRDIMMGGIGGWTSGESHGIETVYGSASSPTTFTRIESYFDGVRASMFFRNFYNSGAQTSVLMTIRGDGNLGIGTTSPSAPLHIARTAAISPGIRLQTTDSTSNGSIMWANSSNTSLAFIGSNANISDGSGNLEFATGGTTTRMVINSSGNVGIGTTNPTRKFQVQGTDVLTALVSFKEISTTADRYSQIEFIAGSRSGYIWLGNENTTSWAGAGGLNIYSDSGNMDFWTNATQKVRITRSGSFLMGDVAITPAETAWFGTGVFGKNGTNKVMIGYLGSLTNGAVIGGHNSALNAWAPLNIDGSELRFNIQESRAVTIISNGNVGIGTTSPTYKLSVLTSGVGGLSLTTSTSTVGGPQIDLYDSVRAEETVISSTDGTTVGTYIASYSNHPLLFGTYAGSTPTAKMAITTGGDVGIGTTTPSAKLQVAGGLAFFSQTATGGSAFRWGELGTAVSADTMLCMNQLWNGSGWTILNSSYGTTYINLGSAVASPDITFGTGPANTAGSVKMIITNAGNVGINTTSPTATLHVQGTTVISGSLNLSGSAIGLPEHMVVALSDETTTISAGTAKVTFRAPFAMRLTDIPRASLTTASTSGLVTVDINESGTSVLGANKLSIDANELTSTTAATPTTIADALIADDAQITMDIDGAGTGAKGLKVTLYYIRT
jgi:hypothetical protein